MPRRPATFLALIALLFTSVALVACGGDGSGGLEKLEPQAVVDKAQSAALGQTNMHAEVDDMGDPGLAASIDFARETGGHGTGESGELTWEVILIDNVIYVSGNDEFLRQFLGPLYAANASRVRGKFIRSTPRRNAQFAGMAEFVDMKAFLEDALTPDGTLSTAEGKDVGGISTVAVADTVRGSEPATLYVANDGSDLPVLLEDATTTVHMSKWGESVELTPPDAGDVVAFSDLVR